MKKVLWYVLFVVVCCLLMVKEVDLNWFNWIWDVVNYLIVKD